MAGYAVVSDSEGVEAELLPQGWSAQRAELISFNQGTGTQVRIVSQQLY